MNSVKHNDRYVEVSMKNKDIIGLVIGVIISKLIDRILGGDKGDGS